jgi:hypothetical protein
MESCPASHQSVTMSVRNAYFVGMCTDFFHSLYLNETVTDQNRFLMPYIVPYVPKVVRPCKENPRKRMQIQYLMKTANGKLVNVCANTFRTITQVGT